MSSHLQWPATKIYWKIKPTPGFQDSPTLTRTYKSGYQILVKYMIFFFHMSCGSRKGRTVATNRSISHRELAVTTKSTSDKNHPEN